MLEFSMAPALDACSKLYLDHSSEAAALPGFIELKSETKKHKAFQELDEIYEKLIPCQNDDFYLDVFEQALTCKNPQGVLSLEYRIMISDDNEWLILTNEDIVLVAYKLIKHGGHT